MAYATEQIQQVRRNDLRSMNRTIGRPQKPSLQHLSNEEIVYLNSCTPARAVPARHPPT